MVAPTKTHRWFHPRFSLRSLLCGVLLLALVNAYFVTPTIRASRFRDFINSGRIDEAGGMLPAEIGATDPYRKAIKQIMLARMTPLTLGQFLRGERRVIVGKGWGGGDVEFIVGLRSISKGWEQRSIW